MLGSALSLCKGTRAPLHCRHHLFSSHASETCKSSQFLFNLNMVTFCRVNPETIMTPFSKCPFTIMCMFRHNFIIIKQYNMSKYFYLFIYLFALKINQDKQSRINSCLSMKSALLEHCSANCNQGPELTCTVA